VGYSKRKAEIPVKLSELIAQNLSISASALSDDKEMSREIQKHLVRLGVLDPPVDGDFGPASLFAFREFLRAAGAGSTAAMVDAPLAKKLVETDALFPVDAKTANLANAIWKAALDKQYWLARAPGYVNIVYVEGANTDGSANDNRPNQFNDLRLVLSIRNGKPAILGKWDATTEPGKFYTEHPLNPLGAARIAFGQYKAWVVGIHGSGAGAHEALVQRGVIKVHRDLNKDYKRDASDPIDTGASFAVNQHWGYDLPPTDIGKASAGCLVGRTKAGHRSFMAIVKEDPRYKVNNGYRFMTAILAASDIQPYLS
jgi:hypothetical protein